MDVIEIQQEADLEKNKRIKEAYFFLAKLLIFSIRRRNLKSL